MVEYIYSIIKFKQNTIFSGITTFFFSDTF